MRWKVSHKKVVGLGQQVLAVWENEKGERYGQVPGGLLLKGEFMATHRKRPKLPLKPPP